MSEITHDHEIREPLFAWLEEHYGIIRIIEEKTMGKSRADAVMITNDALFGIEIKSDADTYTRLSRQVRYYNRFYDYNMIVVGTSHARHVEEHVPAFWGILTVEKEGSTFDFYMQREPLPNPKRKMADKLSLLWRPELVQLLALNGMPKYREKAKKFVEDKILQKVDEDTLNRQISDLLFERDYTLIEKEIDTYKAAHQR